MIETIIASWQWFVGALVFVAGIIYGVLKKINKLEHRIESLEKDQDETKLMLKEIREDIKALLRQSGR